MYRIDFVTCTNNPGGSIFPDGDYLMDYEDSDIGSLSSTLAVETVIGRTVRQLGDSRHVLTLSATDQKGDAGLALFKETTKQLVNAVRTALPEMSPKYKAFFEHFIEDYEKNGIHMPAYGRL